LVSHDMGTLRDICDVGIVSHDAKLHYFKDVNEAIDMYTQINK
jgi:ABC-type polysaccharide/polyol phosphate transport system ATPase subunit